jgi:hypothetical protein
MSLESSIKANLTLGMEFFPSLAEKSGCVDLTVPEKKPHSSKPKQFPDWCNHFLRECHGDRSAECCGRSNQATHPTLLSTSKKLFGRGVEPPFVFRQ